LFNLAAALFISCQVKGNYFDLEIPISLFQDALELRPTGHPDRPTTQLHLAIALLSRLAKRGFQTDANAAEELLNEVLDICDAKSHIYRSALFVINTYMAHILPWWLSKLAGRVELLQQSDDPCALDEVISLHYEALKYHNMAHVERVSFLNNLGCVLNMRFMRRGISHDIQESIKFRQQTLHLCPVGSPDQSLSSPLTPHLQPFCHPDRSSLLNNLASTLLTRFQHQGNDKDLEAALALYTEVLRLRPPGHPGQFSSLNNLTNAVFSFNNLANAWSSRSVLIAT